jgi:hypothetical protein
MKNCDAIVVKISENYVSSDKFCIPREGKRKFHDMYADRSDPTCWFVSSPASEQEKYEGWRQK